MISSFVKNIVNVGIKNERILKEQEEIYLYGYTVLVEVTVCAICSAVIAVAFNKEVEVLLFSVCFIPLRCFGGGYHAATPKNCIAISALMIVLFCILIGQDIIIAHNLEIIAFVFISTVFVFWVTPKVASGDEELAIRCKRTIRKVYLLSLLVAYILYIFDAQEYSAGILLAQISWLTSLIASLFRN